MDEEKSPSVPQPGRISYGEKEDIAKDSGDVEVVVSAHGRRSEGDPDVGIISEAERALVKKLDRRILPIACLMYLFACRYTGVHCAGVRPLKFYAIIVRSFGSLQPG